MNLFYEEEVKPKISPARKKILIMLAVSIFALIVILMLRAEVKKNTPKKLTLLFDGNNVIIDDNNVLIVDEKSEKTYISLKTIADLAKYDYVNGMYSNGAANVNNEEQEKQCYLQGVKQIIGYTENSNKIYKTSMDSSLDNRYFKLKNNIIKRDDFFYIALEDLNVGCNLIYGYSEEDNQILINTLDTECAYFQPQLTKSALLLSTRNFEDQKALLYGMMIVSDNYYPEDYYNEYSSKYGVVDFELKPVIGNLYDSISFNEYTKEFIVSRDGNYGIISRAGNILLKLQYQEIEIINYSPLLYKVKINNKYGILNEDKKVIIGREYDAIGTRDILPEAREKKGYDVVIIENIGKDNSTGLVVFNDGKFGILDLKNGKPIIECKLDKVYYKELNSGKREYIVVENGVEKTLNKYIQDENIIIVNT